MADFSYPELRVTSFRNLGRNTYIGSTDLTDAGISDDCRWLATVHTFYWH